MYKPCRAAGELMTPTMIIIAVGACIATLAIILLSVQVYYLQRSRTQSEQLAIRLEQIEALSKASAGAMVKLGTAQQTMEQRLVQVLRQQQTREPRDARSMTYNQANRLIRMGADADDLVRSCGLSQAEARLVSLVATRGQENKSAS